MKTRDNYYQTLSKCFLLLLLISCCSVDGKVTSDEYKKVKEARNDVPGWLDDYVKWHNIQRRFNLYKPETKFLTVACHKNHFCGGISDRLRPLPFFLMLAHKTNRVLLIKWQKFDLEDFLVPPDGGIDWRLPRGMDIGDEPDVDNSYLLVHMSKKYNTVTNKKNLVVRANRDLYSFISHEYYVTDNHPEGTFSYVWKILFKPVPKLQGAISQKMSELKLVRGKYVSAHYRSTDKIFSDKDVEQHIKSGNITSLTVDDPYHLIENSLACAYQISPDKSFPIYFTSSNTENVKHALHSSEFVKNNPSVNVIGITDVLRLHSDKPYKGKNSYDAHEPSILYPAFIDLYLMAHSACVSYGKLGFGILGARMSGEKCMIDNRRTKCHVN